MKSLQTLALLMLALISISACNSAQQFDLSTDEGVRQAYSHATDKEIEPQDIDLFCIERPKEFEDVILVGWFVDDLGCEWEAVFVGSEFGAPETLTAVALQQNDWQVLDAAEKEQIALTWSLKVLKRFAHDTTLQTEPEYLSQLTDEPFSPPTAQLLANENVLVELWSVTNCGHAVGCDVDFRTIQFEYAPDGTLLGNSSNHVFTVWLELGEPIDNDN